MTANTWKLKNCYENINTQNRIWVEKPIISVAIYLNLWVTYLIELACDRTVFNVFDGHILLAWAKICWLSQKVEYCGFYDKNYIVVYNFNLFLTRTASY